MLLRDEMEDMDILDPHEFVYAIVDICSFKIIGDNSLRCLPLYALDVTFTLSLQRIHAKPTASIYITMVP